MRRSNTSTLNGDTSLQQISSKFDELERIHLTFLRRYQKQNSKIIETEHSISQELHQNLVLAQNQIQGNVKQVTSLSDSFKQDINHLKMIINKNERERSKSREQIFSADKFLPSLEANLEVLKKNIFSVVEMERLEKRATSKLDLYFQQSLQGLKSLISKCTSATRENLQSTFDDSFTKTLQQIKKTNIFSISSIQNSLETIKKELTQSSLEISHWGVSYHQENSFLLDIFEQLKTHISSILTDVGVGTQNVPSSSTVVKEKNNLLSKLKRDLPLIEELLSECIRMNTQKNKFFGEFKHQIEGTNDFLFKHISQIPEHIETLRVNQESLDQNLSKSSHQLICFEKDIESKRQPSPITFTGSRSSSNAKERLSVGIRGTSGEMNRISRVSPLLAIKSIQGLTQTMNEKSYKAIDKSSTIGAAYSGFLQIEDEIHEPEKDMDNLSHKLGCLTNSIKNFILSSDKMAQLIKKNTLQEQTILEIYKSDKKLLENYLERIENHKGLTPRFEKPSNLDKTINHRSSSVDAGRERTINNSGKKRSNNYNEVLNVEEKQQTSECQRSSFKVSSKTLYNIRGIDRVYEEQQYENSRVHQNSKGKIRGESSGAFGRSMPENSSYGNSMLHLKTLKSDLDSLKLKYEVLKSKQLVGRKEEKLERAGTTIEAEILNHKDPTNDVEKLIRENEKLEKTVARLRKKADDRKKTLRQLFELMTEKEKELNVYKWTMGSRNAEKYIQMVQSHVEQKQKEIEGKFKKLKNRFIEKEEELVELEKRVANLSLYLFKNHKTQLESSNEKLSKILICEGKDPSRTKSKEQHISKVHVQKALTESIENLKKPIASKVNEKRGREKFEKDLDMSPNKAKELKGVLDLLKNEKEKLIDEMRNLDDVILSQRVYTEESKSKDDEKSYRNTTTLEQRKLPISVDSLEDKVELKDALIEKEIIIEQLNNEKSGLEEKYNQLFKDTQLAQEHRKKMEKSYQNAINLLDEKVGGLNEYIEELEARNNARIRNELTPEKRSRTPSPQRSLTTTPIKKGYQNLKEINQRLKTESDVIVTKTDEILSYLGVETAFDQSNPANKLEKLLNIIKKQNIVGETKQNRETEESGKAYIRKESHENEDNMNELNWYLNENDQIDSKRSLQKNEIKKLQNHFDNSEIEDEIPSARVIQNETTQNQNNQFLELISKINKVFEVNGMTHPTPTLNQQADIDQIVTRIEKELQIRQAQETYLQRSKEIEEQASMINQELLKQETKYQERVKEIEKNNAAWKIKLEDLEKILKNKEMDLKNMIEQLEGSEADRKQKSVEIESLRKINENLSSERMNHKELEIEESDKKVIFLKIKIEELQKEVSSRQEELESLKEVINAKTKISESLQNELKTNKQFIVASENDSQNLIEELHIKNQSLVNEAEKMKREYQKLSSQISAFERKIIELTDTINQKNDVISQNNDSIQELKQILSTRENKLKEVTDELINIKTTLDEEAERFQIKSKQFEHEISVLNQNKIKNEQQAQIRIEKILKEKVTLENNLAELKKEFQSKENSLNQKENELKSLNEEFTLLKNISEERKKELNELNQNIQKTKYDLAQALENNDKLKDEQLVLQKDLNKALGEREALIAEKTLIGTKSDESIKTITEKISKYEESLQNANNRITELLEEIKIHKNEEQELKNTIKSKQAEIQGLRTVEEQFKKICQEKEANENKFNQRLGELITGWTEADNNNLKLKEEVSELTERTERLQGENNTLQVSLVNYEAQTKQLERELENLKLSKAELFKSKDLVVKEFQEIQTKLRGLEAEKIELLTSMNKSREINSLLQEMKQSYEEKSNIIKVLEEEKENLAEQNKDLNNQNKNLMEKYINLQSKVQEEKDVQQTKDEEFKHFKELSVKEAQDQRNKIQKLEEEKIQVHKIYEELKIEKIGLISRIENFEKEQIDLLSNVEVLEEKNSKVVYQIGKLEENNETLLNHIKKIEEERDEMNSLFTKITAEKEAYRLQVEDLGREKNEIQNYIKQLELEKEISRINIMKIEHNLEESKQKYKELIQEIESLQNQFKDVQTEKKEILLSNEVLKKENQETSIQLQELKNLNMNLQEIKNNMQRKLDEKIENIDNKENKTNDLEQELDNTKSQLQILEKERNSLKTQFVKLEEELVEAREFANKAKEDQEEINKMIDQNQEIQTELINAKEYIQILETKNEDLLNTLKVIEKEKLEAQIYAERMNDENEDMKLRNDELIKSIDIISQEASLVKGARDEASSKLSEFEHDMFKFSDKFEQTRYELETAKKEENKLKAQIDNKMTEIELLTKQNSDLLREKEQLRKDFEKRLSQLRGKKGSQGVNIEYEDKIQKLTGEVGLLQEQNHTLQDQNDDIKRMMVILQEQVISLSEGKQQSLETDRSRRETVQSLQKGLKDIISHLVENPTFEFQLDKPEEIEDCVKFIKERILVKEESSRNLGVEGSDNQISSYNSRMYQEENISSKEAFDIEREVLKNEINLLKKAHVQRLNRIADEIQKILEEMIGELPVSLRKIDDKDDANQLESMIYNYLKGIKVAHQTSQSRIGSATISEEDANIKIQGLQKEKDHLKKELELAREECKTKDQEIQEISFKLKSDDENKDFTWNSLRENDEQKVKSILEENDKPFGFNAINEESINKDREEIKVLYEKLRNLQDNYDKLDSIHKQQTTDYDMLKFLNEDLKHEIGERDDDIQRLNEQLSVLKNELSKMTKERDQSDIAHEKQHIRTMFTKFLGSAIEGNKDSLDLLKLLLSLIGFTEEQKNELIAGYKTKSSTKKSVFGGLFR